MPFQFHRLAIPDVILVEARAFADARGFFLETYKHSAFATGGVPATFVQDNLSHSFRSTLRGLHYQVGPAAQAKLVLVVRGEIFDVAVDIRRRSPSYGRWVGLTLSADGFRMLYIPEGFAHGFCVLSEEADVLYKVTREYSPQHERGIIWNDPEIAIEWPISDPVLSPKDAELPRLCYADNDFQ